MDRDIASYVFNRWAQGFPVQETVLFKAAAAVGADPHAVLLEARYYTGLDRFLKTAQETGDWRLTPAQARFFAAAAGLSTDSIEKVASRFWDRGDGNPLASLVALQERNWVPNLQKLAEAVQQNPLAAMMQPSPTAADPMQGGAQDPAQAELAQQQAMDAAAQGGGGGNPMDPQAGAQVQQQPMFRPSPTAPEQVPPSDGGNLQSILEQAQQQQAQSGGDAAGLGGAEGPSPGNAQDVPPPPSPEEKLQQVMPGIDEKTLARWAPQLAQLEQQTGITVTDPKQLTKFVQQMQKADGKVVDEAIKQLADQQVQQQQMNSLMVGQQQQQQRMASAVQQSQQGGAVPQQPGGDQGQQSQAIQKLAEALKVGAHGRLFG